MVKLNWTDQSIDDLINIAEFIAKDSKKYSVIQLNRIRQKAKIIKNQPFAGRMVPETENKSIRELVIGSYRIIYRIISEKKS